MFGFLAGRRASPPLDVAFLARMAAQGDEETRLRLAAQVAELLAGGAAATREECEAVLPVALRLAMDARREVREALARGLEEAASLPAELVFAIAGDDDEVALPFLRRARCLDTAMQEEVCRATDAPRRRVLCMRPDVAPGVMEMVVARGEREAVLSMLRNGEAALWPALARRLYVRFRNDEEVIRALLARGDLPLEVRLAHVEITHGRAATAMAGEEWEEARRAATTGADMEEQGYADVLCRAANARELEVALAFLARRGRLTAAVLMRAAVAGHVFVLARALMFLGRLRPARVEKAFGAQGSLAHARTLLVRAGLPGGAHALVLAIILAARGEGAAAMRPGARLSRMPARILRSIAETDALSVAEKMQAANMLARFADAQTARLAARFVQTLVRHAA